MRSYETIIKDYLAWYVGKTGNFKYLPDKYLRGPEEDIVIKKTAVWQQIMDLCYREDEGIYWFAKFILGDLMYAGYPQPIRFNKLWWKWTKLIPKGDHIAIKCSRQHGKSTYWTVILPIYRTSLFPNYNVLIESASEDQAIMLLAYITSIINNNEFLTDKRAKNAPIASVTTVTDANAADETRPKNVAVYFYIKIN